MSTFNYKQWLEKFGTGATVYGVELYRTDLTDIESKAISQKIRRVCEKYGISALWGYSTTEHNNNLETKYKLQHKTGRPVKIICGDKVPRHLHAQFVGCTDTSGKHISAKRGATDLKQYLDKRYGKQRKVSKVCSKGSDIHAYNNTRYILSQSDEVHHAGDFDFEKYARE